MVKENENLQITLTLYCLLRTKSARIDKISILKLEGIIKKIPMSVVTMSR